MVCSCLLFTHKGTQKVGPQVTSASVNPVRAFSNQAPYIHPRHTERKRLHSREETFLAVHTQEKVCRPLAPSHNSTTLVVVLHTHTHIESYWCTAPRGSFSGKSASCVEKCMGVAPLDRARRALSISTYFQKVSHFEIARAPIGYKTC